MFRKGLKKFQFGYGIFWVLRAAIHSVVTSVVGAGVYITANYHQRAHNMRQQTATPFISADLADAQGGRH